MEQSKEFQNARIKLLVGQEIFFTDILYRLKLEKHNPLMLGGERSIAATDGLRLMYDEELFGKLTLLEATFVLAHEIMHVVLMHSTRRGDRDPLLWNMAADYVINNLLLKQNGMVMPKEGLYDPAFDKMSTEEVYDILKKDSEKGESSGRIKKGLGVFTDLQDYNGDKPIPEYERELKQAISTALAKTAKQAGSISGTLKRVADMILVDKLPWYTLLQDYLMSKERTENSWSRLNNRVFINSGVICPVKHNKTLRRVALGIDCSGSMTDKQLSSISAHVSDLLKLCRPKQTSIIYFDARVLKVTELEHRNYDVKLESIGGGGTYFEPVFEEVHNNFPDTDLLLMFTDMYADFPNPPSVPCIWVTSSKHVDPPFGTAIIADFND